MKLATLLWALGTALFMASHTSSAVELAVVDDNSSTWVTDDSGQPEESHTAAPPTPAEEVARELFQLQQQMGGSIVTRPDHQLGWDRNSDDLASPQAQEHRPEFHPAPHYRPPTAAMRQQPSPVAVLRETAWQLETSAHRLETMDLYSQADGLREVADQLRKDARQMQKQLKNRTRKSADRPGGTASKR